MIKNHKCIQCGREKARYTRRISQEDYMPDWDSARRSMERNKQLILHFCDFECWNTWQRATQAYAIRHENRQKYIKIAKRTLTN